MIEVIVYQSEGSEFTAYLKRRPDLAAEGPTAALALVSLAGIMMEAERSGEQLMKKLEGCA